MRIAIIFLFNLIVIFSNPVLAADDKNLENGLIEAMRLKQGKLERVGDSGAAIRAYIQNGYLSKKPDKRADYTDYYLLKKPASFMGHTLMVIEEEYMTKYVGCCVNPGIGITVKVNGSAKDLEIFAKDNSCRLSDDADLQYTFSHTLNSRLNFPAGTYASLSCRAGDAEK